MEVSHGEFGKLYLDPSNTRRLVNPDSMQSHRHRRHKIAKTTANDIDRCFTKTPPQALGRHLPAVSMLHHPDLLFGCYPYTKTPHTPTVHATGSRLCKIFFLALNLLLDPQEQGGLPLVQFGHLVELEELVSELLLVALLHRLRQVDKKLVLSCLCECRVKVSV